MPFLVLLIVTMMFLVVAVMPTLLSDARGLWKTLVVLVWVGLIAWIVGATTRSWKVEKEEVLGYSETMLPNGTAIQTLQYLDRDGKPQVINLNEKFKTRLTIASKIKRVQYAPGPYCGVSFGGTTFMHDDFEIVCPMLDKK